MNLGRVFVDTGAWVALPDAGDRHHRSAVSALPTILGSCKSLVTSNPVIGETYTYLRATQGFPEARRFLDGIAASAKLERLFVTEALEREALQILHRSAEQPFSFVDATSFALMRQERLRYAFAFDAHFTTAGFVRIPVDLRLPA